MAWGEKKKQNKTRYSSIQIPALLTRSNSIFFFLILFSLLKEKEDSTRLTMLM